MRNEHIKTWCGHIGVFDDMILPFFHVWFLMYVSIVSFRIIYIMIGVHVTLNIVQQLHPSTDYRTILVCELFWCEMSTCVHFINSLIQFYFVMIVVTIIGISMVTILFILYHAYRLSVT